MTIEIPVQTNYYCTLVDALVGIQANAPGTLPHIPTYYRRIAQKFKTPTITHFFSVVEMLNRDSLPTYTHEIPICPRSSVNPPFSIPAGAN